MPCYTEPHSYCKHGINEIDKAICDFESAMKKIESEFKDLVKNYNIELDDRIKYYKDQSDQATRLLCNILSFTTEIYDPELKEWWEKHKKYDEKREK